MNALLVLVIVTIGIGVLLGTAPRRHVKPSPPSLHSTRRRIQVHLVRAGIQSDALRVRRELEAELHNIDTRIR